MFKVLGVKQYVTSAYHPQSNGQDERTNQTIKRALSKYCNDKQNDWDKHLKAVVYGINTSKQACRTVLHLNCYMVFIMEMYIG